MVMRVRVPRARVAPFLAMCLTALPLGWSTHAAQQADTSRQRATSHKALLDRYCLTCHTQRLKERGTVPIALDTLDLTQVGANAADVGKGRAENARGPDAASRCATT